MIFLTSGFAIFADNGVFSPLPLKRVRIIISCASWLMIPSAPVVGLQKAQKKGQIYFYYSSTHFWVLGSEEVNETYQLLLIVQ